MDVWRKRVQVVRPARAKALRQDVLGMPEVQEEVSRTRAKYTGEEW